VALTGSPTYNTGWQDWLNLASQVTAAEAITRSARERTESRGSHYRLDFPAPSSDLTYVCARAEGGGVRVWSEPVNLTRARPEAVRSDVTVEVGD
jgi:succinate dehydrogenase/fumarate reductase flavoprotein subunit